MYDLYRDPGKYKVQKKGILMLGEEILLKVSKPARYIGGEHNIILKDHKSVKCKVALCFPDVYDVGMSHLGLKILYSVLNEREDLVCERVFAPWHDMEKIMRQEEMPLFTLETKMPVKDSDIVGFSLQFELNYTNVLNMLDLSGIPLFSKERTQSDPLIIGGGPCTFNPEPVADFFDCFVIGDGEDAALDIVDAFIENKKEGGRRDDLLRKLASIESVYVPFYKKTVQKRTLTDLDNAHYPKRPVVPYIDVVHDRMQLEVMRGCRRRCNFCQAGVIYRPNRERSIEKIVSLAKEIYENTGYDEASLLSLSSGDHSRIMEIISALRELFKDKGVSISLPSLRVEDMISRFPAEMTIGRHTGLTFAPEAGSEKLRKIINKDIPIEALKGCAYEAFKNGWRRIKLYFMIGLPGEDYSDLDAIVELAREISEVKKKIDGKAASINASVSVFVPKPHTPFERAAMLPIDEVENRQRYIRQKAKGTKVNFSFHNARMSYIEAALSRGDRALSQAVYNAWKKSCKFDGWNDYFDFEKWKEAFREASIDPDYYALRERKPDEPLPWKFIELR